MSQSPSRTSALIIAGAYFFLFTLVLWPVVDLTSTVYPFRMGDPGWRYGSMGLMAAYLSTPVLAIFLAMVVSYLFGHKNTLRAISVFSVLGFVVLVVVLILFPLDVIQVRSATPEEQRSSFQVGAAIAELKHLTAAVVLALLGFGGWRTTKEMAGKPKSSQSSELTAEVLKAQKRD
ncbi:MAG: hypothetical protein HKO65_03940 [Gemmatimonadetes bacterium]|nr:hypothetical protein [Gemmatimonadota bacterium]NNM04231.1 hypothetical protein [Gemmatimonadota bacterium]